MILKDKFSLIHKFFHINDESYSNREDKIYRVRTVLSRLIRNWQIVMDEKVVRFDGNLSWK